MNNPENRNQKYLELRSDAELTEAHKVITSSFITVANEFNLTKENAPTNPAFITFEMLKKSINDGLNLCGLYSNGVMIGCVGVQKSNTEKLYYIERLAVLPEFRHLGHGKNLLDIAVNMIKKNGGEKISIGIINENTMLKKWYSNYGFKEKGIKTFEHLPFKVCFMEFDL